MSDTALPTFLHYGTNAQRLAFTPSPAAGTQPIYLWYATDTSLLWLYDTSWHQLTSSSLVSPWSGIIQGRLTTESGVPVSTSDRTAQGTLYFTPAINGNAITNGQIALYSGSAVVNVAFTELSLALTLTSGKNYDVFVDYNSGTPQLVLSAAWTNDTTRADALGVQSGLIVKNGTSAYRWVGTIRASGANVTTDASTARFVWNTYNQTQRFMKNATETADSWTYSTATYRQANANTANQLALVVGGTTYLVARAQALVANSIGNKTANVGIGIDSTTVNSAVNYGTQSAPAGGFTTSFGHYEGQLTAGYHFIPWLEFAEASGTTTWYGDAGDATRFQSGVSGTIWN